MTSGSETTEAPPRQVGGLTPGRLRLGLCAAFALVVAAGLLTVVMILRFSAANETVAHTFEVRQVARDLMSAIQDAETGQRGYLLTEEERYLEPFEEKISSFLPTLETLRGLATEPDQHERLDALEPLVQAKQDELRRTVTLAREGRRAEALAIIESDVGQTYMEGVRTLLDEFSRIELARLEERQAEVARLGALRLLLLIVSFAAAVALAGGLAILSNRQVERLGEHAAELEREMRHRQQVEQTLAQSQKMEAVGQLTGGIAHDFNNLMTVVIGNLDTMRRRLASPGDSVAALVEQIDRPLASALQGARSAAQLTHRLLAFARKQPLAPTRIDLNRLITDMSDLLRRTLGETVAVETVLAGGLWSTSADQNQLENALVNLCLNARDAMENSGKLTIETANTYLDDAYASQFGDVTPGQYVVLCVTDTGSGMSKETLGRVFEPFFTTKATGAGTGLGLAMVHGFVKQSGGHVRIYSEVGHGTTVKIYLPRLAAVDPRPSAPAPREAAAPGGLALAKPGETILVVEDNDGVRDYAKAILEELGYMVLVASDAAEAAPFVNGAGRIDLLFTDVILPGGVGGRQIAERAVARRPGLPVLFTTGYTPNAVVHNGRLDAGIHLLSKPYAHHALAAKVRELIDAAAKARSG